MKEPYYLTLHVPDKALPRYQGAVPRTEIEEATPAGQAVTQNELATQGRSQTLLAGTPLYWQRKLARALIVGFVAGIVAAVIWPW